jgi:glycosyltransferase involved in cell wall biosynthesis
MGGGQYQVLHLLRGLVAHGVGVGLLARGELLRAASREGFDTGVATIASVAGDAPSFDLVHAHDAKSHTWGAVFAASKLVVSRRVVFAVGSGWLSRWKYARPRRFIAISSAVRGELERAGVTSGKIDIVPDGVPIPECVIPYAERPADRFFGIVKDSVRDAAVVQRLGLKPPRDLADDIRTARALVYLSESEGLGSAALLAMAYGVPVIASRTGGLIEVVEDGVSGILVDRAEQAESAVRRLRQDPVLAEQLGQAGRDRAAKMFSVATMVEGSLRVYRKVIKEGHTNS